MSLLQQYLNSETMAMQIYHVNNLQEPEDIKFETTQMVYAAIRWHQLFENKNVDHKRIGLKPANKHDFQIYLNQAAALLKDPDIDEAIFHEKVNDLLGEAAARGFNLRPNDLQTPLAQQKFYQRFVALLTMGACEFHGYNGAFEQSIRKNGLNANAKFLQAAEMTRIDDLLCQTGSQLGMARKDQHQISTTTRPDSAYLHAKCSPEWFYALTTGDQKDERAQAYIHRDYATAHANVFDSYYLAGLDAAEKEEIAVFFDKCWQKFAALQKPKMVMLPYFRNPKHLDQQIALDQMYLKMWGPEKTLQAKFGGDCYNVYEHKHVEPIDRKYLEFIDLPTTLDISYRIKVAKAKTKLYARQALTGRKAEQIQAKLHARKTLTGRKAASMMTIAALSPNNPPAANTQHVHSELTASVWENTLLETAPLLTADAITYLEPEITK